MSRQAAIELLRRDAWVRAIRDDLFDKQLAVYDDPAQFKANHAGRRGGKSTEIPSSSAEDTLDAGFNEVVIIGAETQKKARALHWANIQSIAVKHKLPLTPNIQEGSWSTPWGSKLIMWGLADQGAIELLRGFKLKAARFDEVQTYASMLPRLISSVIEPALGDTGGKCTLYGTPSETRSGPWADICLGVTPGWSVHHWDVRDNKKFPRDAMSMLQQVLLRNKWTWDHPIFQREWLGEFVNDIGQLVYKFDAKRNTAEALPCRLEDGFCTIGIDYGTKKDSCAWVVLWSPNGSREIYVVEARKEYGMLPDDAAVITKDFMDRWRPRRTVGDGGGLGAPYVEAFNRRYSHLSDTYVRPAAKLGRLGQIAIVNGELSSGRIKLLPGADDLKHEIQVLPWKDEKRLEEKEGFDNHAADAFRYAVNTHFADVPVAAPPPKSAQQIEDEALAERQRRARERKQAMPEF